MAARPARLRPVLTGLRLRIVRPFVHAGCVEPIFEAALADDPSGIAAIVARTPGAAAQRMAEDLFVAELHHMLYRGDTPLHLAAAGLRYDAARALLAAGAPVNAVNRRGATSLHYACDPRPLSPTWDPGATMADVDRNGVAVADRIQSQALRDA